MVLSDEAVAGRQVPAAILSRGRPPAKARM